MRIVLEEKNKLKIIRLPKDISGNYWVTDSDNQNLINVIAFSNNWVLKSNTEVKISNDPNSDALSNINLVDSVNLNVLEYHYITNVMTKKNYILYCLPDIEEFSNLIVDYNRINKLIIGSQSGLDISIDNKLMAKKQLSIELNKQNNGIVLKNIDVSNKLFVNNDVIEETYLSSGDVIFIAGVYIYYFGALILVSNTYPVIYDSVKIQKRIVKENVIKDYSEVIDKDMKLIDRDSYYQRPPRFKREIKEKTFVIDAPTQKEKEEDMPLVFTIAPMLTMAMMSMVSGLTSFQKVISGESTFKDEAASLLVCICMIVSMILFPIVQKFYVKMKRLQKERKRRRKYKKYIDQKREEIFKEINYQKQVLIEDNLPLGNVTNIILNKQRNLFERKIDQIDFLDLRLGIGTRKPKIDIKYPEEHFTMEEDDLRDIISDLVNESKDIIDVPITLNFRSNNKVGLIGEKKVVNSFIDNLMLQIMAYHGYDMLRIVILTNEKNKNYWEKYRNLSHVWNDDKQIRFYASNKDDINKITSYLKEEYNYRLDTNNDNVLFTPYYLIFTDDVGLIKNNFFIKDLLKSNTNLGYSMILNVEKVDELPNECSMFINVAPYSSGIFSSKMQEGSQTSFKPDLVNFPLRNYITSVSNIHLDIASGKYILPKTYGFLEMYDVGNVNQLNIVNRWKNNDIINSLEAPVGIDEQGELFKIDLHEKAHGPHGLVAGMTGSGKSEWIITFILSMALNYSPEEVQFVLIDYKGGGLALTFDDRENNIKLPHVVGTITNLDIVEIKRSLASIESELKRRQAMFKSAREKLNESSMDIYKYQELYRAGKVEEPMSHLFIVSDEFAELKAQQPEFMDELISTARIGRSLGVHLILATQKPSGVVDDQIWSNSKFRVCLKVQDKSDSNDMLKCPDAAMLKETGRFYLQVGYNEFFAKGQAAYAGVPYYESDKKITVVDSNVDFLNEVGGIVKKGNITKKNTQYVYKGEELPNVLNYIIESAKQEDLKIKPLWLSRIPNTIYVDKLKEKYNFTNEKFVLNPIIGEYDDPSKQHQDILTIPLSKEGNAIIYGSSGSGKENLLTTLIYSLISSCSIEEVNIYIADFGSHVLSSFDAAPHVGDIVYSGDDEKIENLFKMLKSEIKMRKKLFLNYNGSYEDYIKSTNEVLPNLVIVFNSFEVFSDLYEEYLDVVSELTRECNKYGIYFVLTSASVNGVKTKVSQNFKNILTLQLNDVLDYRNILGNTGGMLPSKSIGRGLIKLDRVVEFQIAYAFKKDSLYDNLKTYCVKLFMQYKMKARKIPVLPQEVTIGDVVKNEVAINNIPVGIIKKSLGVAKINLTERVSYLVSVRSFEDIMSFANNFIEIVSLANSCTKFIFDAKFAFENVVFSNINYMNSDYSGTLNNISKYVDQVYDVLESNKFNKKSIASAKEIICIIVGLETFINGLKDDDKVLFKNIMKKAKTIMKVHFIFIDTAGSLKKCEYEDWYKETVDSTSGVWIGDGFAEQYVIKPTKLEQSYYEQIGTKFGYIVENGVVSYMKIVEKSK